MAKKLIWKASEAPTGRYRSFQRRSWPTATWGKDGPMAVALYSFDNSDYVPRLAELIEIEIRVADHRTDPEWHWRKLKARGKGLKDAKRIAAAFFEAHPEFKPKED